ncbi:MAG: hypothetical protein VW270_06005 [Candidatus Poseidoniales archaeon]
MKVFAAASSSSDSTYLLYKLLTETTDDIVSRILHLDASDHDLEQYPIVCNWLRENVRDFDFDFAEFEDRADDTKLETIRSKLYNVALLSEMHDVDLICMGYNTYNWSPSNWYFQTTEAIEKFYERGNLYTRLDHSIFRDYTDIPIDWPLMSRETKPMGRWQTWESIPQELQRLVSICPCGECSKCKCWEWYNKKKQEGFSAEELDDLIMKEGKYGKYYTKDSIKETRHNAYGNRPLPTKPHNK